jgi:hypothetical protein
VSQLRRRQPQRIPHRCQRTTADIPYAHPLQGAPDTFHRSAVRRGAGELLQPSSFRPSLGQQVLDHLPPVERRAIPDHAQRARAVGQAMLEQAHHPWTAQRRRLDLQQDASARRHGTDRRPVGACQRTPLHWWATAWGVRADTRWQQVTAGCIDPATGSSCGCRLFVRSGHRVFCQAWSAAASRWVACVTGNGTRWPHAHTSRRTWAGWYATPQRAVLIAAIRLVVQTSPIHPNAGAPCANAAPQCARCAGDKRGDAPGAGRRRSAALPPSRPRCTQRLIAPCVTPTMAAIACCFQPCCWRSQARCRRPSRHSLGLYVWCGARLAVDRTRLSKY